VVGFRPTGVSRRSSSPTAWSPSHPRSGVASRTCSGRATTGDGPGGGRASRGRARIENGPSYTQLRLGRNGPQVIEVGRPPWRRARRRAVEAVTGIDLNGLAIDAALGTFLVPSWHKPGVGGATTRFLVAPARSARAGGGAGDAAGVELVRILPCAWPHLHAAPPWFRPGRRRVALGDSRDRPSRARTPPRSEYAS